MGSFTKGLVLEISATKYKLLSALTVAGSLGSLGKLTASVTLIFMGNVL